MIQAKFIDESQVSIDEVEVIDVEKKYTLEQPSYTVIVSNDKKAKYLLRIYFSDEADCFHDLKYSNEIIFIGCGEKIYVFNCETNLVNSFVLNGYFGHLYPVHDIYSDYVKGNVLVASASNLININESGEVVWQSGCLGIDGVVVDGISNGVIFGSGEYDPPGGWEKFNLDLQSGKNI